MNACLTWSELVLARRDSEAPALIGERAVSYAELFELAAAAAGWLDELGFAGGSPVPALLDTSAVSLALVNLFDTDPPIIAGFGGYGNTYPATYDYAGMTFFIGVNVKTF